MKSLRAFLSGVFATVTLAFLRMPIVIAQSLGAGAQAAHGDGQPTELLGDGAVVSNFTNTLLFLVGAVAVIMIIYGGFRYVVSGGNSSNVTAAKNTILYAIVGVIVAVLAYAIIDFVITSFSGGGAGSSVGGSTNGL